MDTHAIKVANDQINLRLELFRELSWPSFNGKYPAGQKAWDPFNLEEFDPRQIPVIWLPITGANFQFGYHPVPAADTLTFWQGKSQIRDPIYNNILFDSNQNGNSDLKVFLSYNSIQRDQESDKINFFPIRIRDLLQGRKPSGCR